MKKKLNVFCVLMLVLMALQVIMSVVLNFNEHVQAFNEGWQEGRNGDYVSFGGLLIVILGVACFYLIIRSLVSLVRFILNVNRDKVFVWQNVALLRWAGWGLLIPYIIIIVSELLNHVPIRQIYIEDSDSLIFGVFCLIMAEVFAIGLKLKEEQDLTI